ncbi:hypothetical protein [Candidatus Mycobacterium methanotrophicum]|uniref:hypothetical protein n=1 Tax=Candidatus Mycobacterium methanotrophicum TaxID=2943498 RepID=UPI001C5744CE
MRSAPGPDDVPARPAPRRSWLLRWFRDGAAIRILAAEATLGISTCYRYLHEAIDVIAEHAPDLHEVLDQAKREGWSHLTLDGTPIEIDRAGERTEEGNHRCYPGKHKTQASIHAEHIGADTWRTFLSLPRLSGVLAPIPPGADATIELAVDFIDHAAHEAVDEWQRQHRASGGTIEIHDLGAVELRSATAGPPTRVLIPIDKRADLEPGHHDRTRSHPHRGPLPRPRTPPRPSRRAHRRQRLTGANQDQRLSILNLPTNLSRTLFRASRVCFVHPSWAGR